MEIYVLPTANIALLQVRPIASMWLPNNMASDYLY